MLLLALDTSTRQASVALVLEDELLGENTWYVGNNHSVELLDCIARLLSASGSAMQEIDGVAVATGPGSFNGVRVALATAKALAFALKKPLVGVSTLDIIAFQQRQRPGPICSVLEAGRSELYAACYMFDEMSNDEGDVFYSMQQLSDYLLLSPQDLSTYLQENGDAWAGVPGERQGPSILFCGEMSPASRQALYQHMQGAAFFVSSLQSTRHASQLATLALQRLQEGRVDDPLLLEPLYLRRPSITTSARKQPLLGNTPKRTAGEERRGPTYRAHGTEREEGALRH